MQEEENAWEGDQAKDKKNQKDKKDQKGKKDQKDKKNQKNKKDQKDKRRVAAKAANRAFTKVVPAIQACVSAAPGKCDSVAIWTGVSNGVAELGPLIKAFTKYGQYVPMIGNIVGLVGSLLGLLVGNAPGKSPAPISIDDMRNVVSQELYTFKMSEQGWKLKGALVAVNHLLRNYGIPAACWSYRFSLNLPFCDSLWFPVFNFLFRWFAFSLGLDVTRYYESQLAG